MNEPAIETKGLGKRYGRTWAVRDLDLQVEKGSVFGLLGPNGAGKTTTIQMLMGLLPPTEGSISVLGFDPARKSVEIKRRVGYVPEIHGFYDWMSVGQLVDFVSAYHRDWNKDTCKSLMKEFNLDGYAKVGSLSKGMRAKTALLLALSFDPEMLILDEPTGGLDPAARRNFIETILGRFQESGKTILVTSHLVNEFSGILDSVAFMQGSKLHSISRLDDLYRRVKRVRLVFPDGVPAGFTVSDAVRTRVNGREAVVTIDRFNPEETPRRLKDLGASGVTVEDLTLEDIFVEMVGT